MRCQEARASSYTAGFLNRCLQLTRTPAEAFGQQPCLVHLKVLNDNSSGKGLFGGSPPAAHPVRVWTSLSESPSSSLHLGVILEGDIGPGEPRWMGEEDGDSCTGLMGSPVWSLQSSSSFVRLSRFFSLLSFSTCSCRFAFSSDNSLQAKEKHLKHEDS